MSSLVGVKLLISSRMKICARNVRRSCTCANDICMYVCMYVCVCIYIYIYVCAKRETFLHLCKRYINTHIHACIYVYACMQRSYLMHSVPISVHVSVTSTHRHRHIHTLQTLHKYPNLMQQHAYAWTHCQQDMYVSVSQAPTDIDILCKHMENILPHAAACLCMDALPKGSPRAGRFYLPLPHFSLQTSVCMYVCMYVCMLYMSILSSITSLFTAN